MKNLWKIVVMLVVLLMLVACAPPAVVEDSVNPNVVANGTGGFTDKTVYSLTVRIGGPSKDHTETHGSGSSFGMNGYSSGSISIWQEGKGIIPAKVLAISPNTPIVKEGDDVILKSEDLKMARLEEGWVAEIKCRMDYEPIQVVELGERVDPKTYQTWELDVCRMTRPSYTVGR